MAPGITEIRSRPGKPNQRKDQNEKFMNFTHFCEFWCFSLGKQARFTLNFCSGMPLRKVHELTLLWFGLPGPLLKKINLIKLCIRNENSAQRGSYRPDIPAEIPPKTSVRPSKPWKNVHFGTDIPRGRPCKNFGLKNFGLIFRSLMYVIILVGRVNKLKKIGACMQIHRKGHFVGTESLQSVGQLKFRGGPSS